MLVDQTKLLEELAESVPMNWSDTESEISEVHGYRRAMNIVERQPTIDIVKCAECTNKDTEDCPMSECIYINKKYDIGWITDPKAQFCSYGERQKTNKI